ncbi:MAG: DNA-binding protein [Bacteroides sp.]|nr:DNA-binding protein [Bacteroides sp.]
MLDYSVSARYNPMEKNEPAKYYASSQTNEVINLEQFAKHIATHGSVYKRADIAAVLTMAVDCLREMLLSGTKVQLGDLGSFYVTFSSEGTMSPTEFNPELHIKSVNVNWERGADFLNLKEDATFNLVAIRSIQKKVLKAVKNGESTVSIVDEEEESSEG